MSTPLEYGWRTGSFQVMRGGLYAVVERWWCDGDNDGWRWRGFLAADVTDCVGSSDLMSFDEAKRLASEWIDARISRLTDLSVYQFAGLEGGVAP